MGRLAKISDAVRAASPATLRNAALDAGVGCVCLGIGAFDWRYGLIALGVIVSGAALWGKANDRNSARPR